MRWLSEHYLALLRWSLQHRWIIVVATCLCMASLVVLAPLTKFTFLPQDDASEPLFSLLVWVILDDHRKVFDFVDGLIGDP